MKLISNYKDYYDGILYSMTEPNNKIWERYESDIKWVHHLNLTNIHNVNRFSFLDYDKKTKMYTYYLLEILVVCGKIFPYYKKIQTKSKHYFVNDYFSVLHDVDTIFDKDEVDKLLSNRNNRFMNLSYDSIINEITPLVNKVTDIELESGVLPVIIKFVTNSSRVNRSSKGLYYYTNVNLSKLNFTTVMDDYTVFKEIEIYINERLNTEVSGNTMTDKEKIQTYGFDDKTSFRKSKKNT